MKKCKTRNCRKFTTTAQKSPYCGKCRDRRWRAKHPISWCYNSLKKHAKLRGKVFTLTKKQFHAFAIRTDYHRLVGKSSLSLSIDRIDNSLGYHDWNIQAITVRENCRKEHVPYYNQGMTAQQRREYVSMEHRISKEAETLALVVHRTGLAFGSPEFWKMFRKLKALLCL